MRTMWRTARTGVMSRVKGVAVWRLSSTAAPVATSGATALPAAVDTIVVGGGIIGASCGWQLARLGRRVLVLEQNTLTSGTTWHGKSTSALSHLSTRTTSPVLSKPFTRSLPFASR